MNASGEQPPTAEAKAASNKVTEETAIAVKEDTDKIEKAPVGNFWVRVLLRTREGMLTRFSGFFRTGRLLMAPHSSLVSCVRRGQARYAIVYAGRNAGGFLIQQ